MTTNRRAWPIIGALALAVFACSGAKTTSVDSPVAPSVMPTFARIDIGVLGAGASTLAAGQTLQLYAVGVEASGAKTDVTNLAQWSSANTAIAAVTAAGLVTGVADGTATVSAGYASVVGTFTTHVAQLCSVSVSPVSLVFNAVGSVPCSDDDGQYGQSLTITASKSSCTWLAASDVPWLGMDCYGRKQTYDPHRAGTGVVNYKPEQNTTQSVRTGHITVTFGDGSRLVHTVTQEGARCLYSFSPAEGTLPHNGGSGAFDLTVTPATCEWRVDSRPPEMSLSALSGTGPAHVTYTVANQPAGVTAYGLIIVDPLGQSPSASYRIVRLPQ